MFRHRKSLSLSYNRQGYIYFISHNYSELTGEQQAAIRQLCREISETHHKALLEFMTTEATVEAVCRRHYIAPTTLCRLVLRYYRRFPRQL